MRSHIVVLVIGIGAFVGCTTTTPISVAQLDALGEHLARTLCSKSLTRFVPIPNRHVSGQVDQIETRECSNGTASLHTGKTTADPNGLALSVEVNAPGAGLPSALEIGQPIARALATLGPPASRSHGVLDYYLSADGPSSVSISTIDDRISSVHWVWDID